MSEERQDGGTPGARGGGAPETAQACTLEASTHVSHTQVPQMTASSAPPADDSKWCCESCTYENFPMSKKCTMCRTPKSSLGEDIFKLQDGANALPEQDVCDAEGIASRLKPLRISSPQQHVAGASANSKWPCPTCTYENWPKSLKCAMCGTNNSSLPATANDPERNKPTIGINEICESEDSERVSKRGSSLDRLWLQACLGVVENSIGCVEAYLSAGGGATRALSAREAAALRRPSAFDAGHTLVHLAIRFQRQEILTMLLSRISGGGPGLKRSPSYIAPDLAAGIRRRAAASVRPMKGSFPAQYINEFCTFYLPAEIEDLPSAIQEQLFTELLDREAQCTLEAHPPLINWNMELGSRLYALWNRSQGDCLTDALCQAAYGVCDTLHTLRGAMQHTLHHPGFFERFAAWERWQAAQLQYAATDAQLRHEFSALLHAAARPRAPLDQLHVFALAHVLRRPVLVYGVPLLRSFRGEPLDLARAHGIYLPLLWEPSLVSPSPLCVGYTRGHFCALVPPQPAREQQDEDSEEDVNYVPLTDSEGKTLPVHFLTCEEMAEEEAVIRRWLSVCETHSGLLAARQTLHPRPLLQAQMLEEWLNHYRRLQQQTRGPFPPRLQRPLAPPRAPPDAADD